MTARLSSRRGKLRGDEVAHRRLLEREQAVAGCRVDGVAAIMT
jgi:hypothetical protein